MTTTTQLWTNNAAGWLASPITAGATSIMLATGQGARFPDPASATGGYFDLTLFQRSGITESNHEIVRVTARSGDTLTVTRGQEGTTARAFNAMDPVELRVTAGVMGRFRDTTVPAETPVDLTGTFLAGATTVAVTGGYDVGRLSLFHNGSRLTENVDFTATDGANVVLATGLAVDDVLVAVKRGAVATSDLVSLSGALGSTLVGNGTETVADSLNALQLADYTALRAYAGPRKSVYVTGTGIAGMFVRDDSDTTTADNGGTVIVASNGKRWKRQYSGYVDVRWFGAKLDGVTDDTQPIQAAINSVLTSGGDILIPDGATVITATLTVNGNGVKLNLSHNTAINYSTPNGVAVQITGSNCSIVGGFGAGFIGPSVWDGTNVAPTYAVIQFLGNNGYARTRLQNIKKVGIQFKDVIDGTVEGCRIEGNYPVAQWTGVETGHHGVLFDPSNATTAGNFKAIGNTIKSCVQGIMAANYGSGPLMMQGFLADANIFEGCWNHGIYSNFTAGGVINGNSFNRCQIGVVASGDDNSITGNTMYTSTNTAGDQRDVVGISVRDGSRNVISGNTIKGTLSAGNIVAISIQDVNGLYPLNDNIVIGNTIDITDGQGVAIRILGNTHPINRNIIANNNINCPGTPSEGAISVEGQSGALNLGNKVHDNIVTLSAPSFGVYHMNLTCADVHNNTVEYAFNALSATSLLTVGAYNATNCAADNNASVVRAGFGANISIYGYRELTSASNNSTRNNINQVDTTGGASYSPLLGVSGSGLLIDQSGTGVPAYDSRVGSRWYRTDGAAGATFYIREASATPTVWRAV